MTRSQTGFTLIELLCVVALLGVTASLPLVTSGSDRDRLQLDAAARRLLLGLERARSVARREQMACGIALKRDAWSAPEQEALPGGLPSCPGVSVALQEALHQGPILLHTNLPAVVRVTANGLLLDGGTTVLSHGRLDHTRCLVVSLPLGVSRLGHYQGGPPVQGQRLSSRRCLPDPQEA
ncbi:prepilin-type N-terminal cleavage/methylation domain containing protein [Synechococcus sp. A18-25c]|uniref:GspH/FimT family pseudopilin n=1 Tax=Synechococcus sp. A18-25c TaxID=1866938 RepID=UPI0016455AF8|nr:GspH/FimT family protein [Synechococcus sp. A18-25c]QNJ20839.1 prepilin-type N-terminal cleavage/methylation domain containing protein [Synechococcus sp. A18-25c]